MNVQVLKAMRVMAEPITAEGLAAALGRKIQYCAHLIWIFSKDKGWLKKTARGKYERTEAFPKSEIQKSVEAEI